MRRRDFFGLVGGAAAWPIAAQAQQGGLAKRLGVLMRYAADDPEGKVWHTALLEGLGQLGWMDGRNLRIDVRWAGGRVDRLDILAKELVDLQPDVMLANSTATTHALDRETHKIPIVFAAISDPVGDGFIAGLAHPGGNLTGSINIEATMGGKWVELLTEIAPGIKRAAMMFNPDTAPGRGSYYMPSFEAAARSFKLVPISADVHSDAEIAMVITSLGSEPGGGLVVMPDNFPISHRAPIISLAAQYKVPAVYWNNIFSRDGGLLSYGTNEVEIFRRSASYIDRILRGEKPGDLPVEVPTKFQLVLNLNAAKALGLTVPPNLLATADEVIE